MNTNALKRFAKEARIKLLDQVGRKLEFVLTQDSAELRGKETEIAQLKSKVQQVGKAQVIEMVAYTWFNRLMALRFMDANGYTLPKVVSPADGNTGNPTPEILQEAKAGNIDDGLQLDRQRIKDLLGGRTSVADAHTEAYKMLLVAACNQWHAAMPFMFERISDYTELLLPDDLLSERSIVSDVRNGMSEEDCKQEELIGWLYQFYIADKKDDVFADLKKNIKITAENIPAATQLFTPRWIVRYMVENTLGKIWMTLKPESKLRDHMPYYIEAPEGNAPAPIPDHIKSVTDITFLDPCQGSGHVLVYAFDLFSKIYEEEGYNTNEIPALILEHNLYGIDIDPRAAQLAAFALTMKARSYYSRFLRKPMQPHVIALENVSLETIQQAVKLPVTVKGKKITNHDDLSLRFLAQADNLGSLIQIEAEEVAALQVQLGSIWQEKQQKLKEQAEILSQTYDCVVTNPPYLGGGGMNDGLRLFVEGSFPRSKADLMACFIERCLSLNPSKGRAAIINQQSWMFLSSYDTLRTFLIAKTQFESMLHLGPRTFPEIGGEVVQNTAFVLGNYDPIGSGVFIRLITFENPRLKEEKTIEALAGGNSGWYFFANQKDFEKIPGSPIGYWLRENFFEIFKSENVGTVSGSDGQTKTGNNDKYLRLVWEVPKQSVGKNAKWVKHPKGGSFRRWYGNIDTVIDWSEDARKHYRKDRVARILPDYLWWKKGLSWTLITGWKQSFRDYDDESIFNLAAPTIFFESEDLRLYCLGLLNTKIAEYVLKLLNPTLNCNIGEVQSIPLIQRSENFEFINQTVAECCAISKEDWDIRELSTDFKRNALVQQFQPTLRGSIESFESYWTNRFVQLHCAETNINQTFIEIYELQDELSEYVPLPEITILQEELKPRKQKKKKSKEDEIDEETWSKEWQILETNYISNFYEGLLLPFDKVNLVEQFLSYAIGCLFGRFSLQIEGLVLANEGETIQEFLKLVPNPSFLPDDDNIIPILDGEWFTDDIVGRFREFLKVAFSAEHFEENLKYIEDTIGKDIRKYFVKDFYNDHIKRYKKRPLYWMFSSPKGHFKALIYMHRYQPDLCSKLLNDYLQAFISKLEAAKQTQNMLSLREDITPREKNAAIKEMDKLELMLKDCREYEKTLFKIATQKISIDLDDGVKVNYQKFKHVLVPIKGLEKDEE